MNTEVLLLAVVDVELLEWIKQVGFPTIALIIIGKGLWQAAGWLGEHFLLPIKDAVVEFLKKLSVSVDTIKTSVTELVQQNEEIRAEQVKQSGEHKEIIERLEARRLEG